MKFHSVVSRIIALHLVAIVVTSICMPLALYMMLNYAAQELHHRALRERAAEILRYLDRGPDGAPRLSLPAALAEFYSEAYGRSAYAVLDPGGRVADALDRREQQADEDRDDRDHHQQLNEREAGGAGTESVHRRYLLRADRKPCPARVAGTGLRLVSLIV